MTYAQGEVIIWFLKGIFISVIAAGGYISIRMTWFITDVNKRLDKLLDKSSETDQGQQTGGSSATSPD